MAKTGVTRRKATAPAWHTRDDGRPADAMRSDDCKDEDAGNIDAVIATPVERGGNPRAERKDLPDVWPRAHTTTTESRRRHRR